MIKNIILAIFVIGLAVGLTFGLNTYFKSNKGDFFILERGSLVPNFSFQTASGQSYDLYDFQGRTVVVHFWASWCAPCVIEFPEIVEMAAGHADDVTVIAFSSDRTAQAIDKFLNKQNITLPDNFLMIHDKAKDYSEGKFSVFQLPESFIINPDMTLDAHLIGAYKDWLTLF